MYKHESLYIYNYSIIMLGPSVNIHEGKGSLDLFLYVKFRIFSYTSLETCFMGSCMDCLMETVLLSTYNIWISV